MWIRSLWSTELINLQEQAMALYLDNRNRLIGYRLISSGNRRGTIVDVQLVTSIALHTLAVKVILVHNHPSGSLIPSNQDIKITLQVKAALAIIDVKLLDHIIITEDCYLSMRGHGVV
jgi:DNA repair protein RadC